MTSKKCTLLVGPTSTLAKRLSDTAIFTESTSSLAKWTRSTQAKRREGTKVDDVNISYFEQEFFINSTKYESKGIASEDLEAPDLPYTWFINLGLKKFNNMVNWELVFYEFEFAYFKNPKFSFVGKLENLGCIGLFEVGDVYYPSLVHLFYANFVQVVPKGRGRTFDTTQVKNVTITLTILSFERILNVTPDPSKFPPLLS